MTRRRHTNQSNNQQGSAATGPVSFQIEGPVVTDAFVLHVEFTDAALRANGAPVTERSAESRLAEAVRLAVAIDLSIVGQEIATLGRLRPSTLLGTGKVEEIAQAITACDAELVIVNAQLTPAQQRNLERAWNAKVLDRTGLILEIFGRRAQTREGSLQVELAHLTYQKSRLVRSWTHLERQRGGSGFLGGPGETQLEADRRIIQNRITKLRKQLSSVAKTRGLHRHARARVPYPIVALVGYTNAGKSTLFNRLTGATVDARDLLFATLDPTMRQITLPRDRKAILSDTVGFISDLPTSLVAAFRATLEEVVSADVILHVRDISHPETDAQSRDVHLVLSELGLDERERDNMIEVWNKSDLLDADARRALLEQTKRNNSKVCLVSAVSGEGIDALLELIGERIAGTGKAFEVDLSAADGAELAWLYQNADVISRTDGDDGSMHLRISLDEGLTEKALQRFGDRMRALGDVDQNPIAAE